MSRSGSKSSASAARPPELAVWQDRALRAVAGSGLARELVFGGGAALAALHLHHRTSLDVDFFAMRQIALEELTPLRRALGTPSTAVHVEVVGLRTSLVLRRRAGELGRIDFAYHPFDPIGRRTSWRGLAVESLIDMTVNKIHCVVSREQPRDFVDLYFLLREGPERDLMRLLDLLRAKFDLGAHPMGLARRLLLVHQIRDLPRMIRPIELPQLVAFFEDRARELVRSA